MFDKLLILRALRPEFPEALFFTTDSDEAFTIKSELPFTRNLIISSSFGPNLSDWLQGGIPFFRDTYETSAFLATQLAIGLAKDSDISNQLLAPRIFEVKRSGKILPFAWEVSVPLPQNHDGEHEDNSTVAVTGLTEGRSEWPCRKGDGLSNCVHPTSLAMQLAMVPSPQNHGGEFTDSLTEGRSEWPCRKGHDRIKCYIQPVDREELKKLHNPNDPKAIEKLFPTLDETARNDLPRGLAGGALFGLGLLCFRDR